MSLNVVQKTLTTFYEDCREILESDLLQRTDNQLKIDKNQIQAIKRDGKFIIRHVKSYLDSFDGTDTIIEKADEKNDLDPLKQFVAGLQEHEHQIKTAYDRFSRKCSTVRESLEEQARKLSEAVYYQRVIASLYIFMFILAVFIVVGLFAASVFKEILPEVVAHVIIEIILIDKRFFTGIGFLLIGIMYSSTIIIYKYYVEPKTSFLNYINRFQIDTDRISFEIKRFNDQLPAAEDFDKMHKNVESSAIPWYHIGHQFNYWFRKGNYYGDIALVRQHLTAATESIEPLKGDLLLYIRDMHIE